MKKLNLTELKDLRKKSQTVATGENLGAVSHRSRHSAYRVVVYRLNTSGFPTFNVDGVPTSYDDIFNSDPISENYIRNAMWFAEDPETRVTMLLSNYYASLLGKIQAGLDSMPGAAPHSLFNKKSSKSLIIEHDITPLVTSVGTSIGLDSPNACTLQMLNPTIAAFNLPQLDKFYNFNEWRRLLSAMSLGGGAMKDLFRLKSFKLREYDLVRVFIYTGEEPLSRRMAEVEAAIPDTEEGYKEKREHAICNIMPVAFTGLVVGMNYQNAVDGVASTSVECQGVTRFLANTSTVVDQALCNQITMQNRDVAASLSMDAKPVTVFSNFYTNKHALDCFLLIINEYFKADLVLSDGEVAGGVPSIFRVVEAMFPEKITKTPPVSPISPGSNVGAVRLNSVDDIKNLQDVPVYEASGLLPPAPSTRYPGPVLPTKSVLPPPSFVQMLNTLLAYHAVKTYAAEPIFVIDDAINPCFVVNSDGSQPHDLMAGLTYLRPYLLMTKPGFSTFDSTYESPYSIFETIRQNTFLEIFEDRQGTFHLRFPRYNCAIMDRALEFSDTMSVSVSRIDSGNMNVVQAKWMRDMIGAVPIPAWVYVDPLSVFKYGTRVTPNIENPNCVTPSATAEFAKFYRYYHLGAQSRTADISCLGDPFMSPGKMVSFKVGYAGAQNMGVSSGSKIPGLDSAKFASSNIAGGASVDYVGYVGTVSDAISVDGMYTQRITAKFVRDAQLMVAGVGDVTEAKSGLAGSARRDISLPESLLDRSWGTLDEQMIDTRKFQVASETDRKKYLSVWNWFPVKKRESFTLGIFQNTYGVHDLTVKMLSDLQSADQEFWDAMAAGGNNSSKKTGDTICSKIPGAIKVLDSLTQSWAENRAAYLAIKEIEDITFKAADGYRTMGATGQAWGIPDLKARLESDIAAVEERGTKALRKAKGQKVLSKMGKGDVRSSSEKVIHLFEPGTLVMEIDREVMPKNEQAGEFYSTKDKVSFEGFCANIKMSSSDMEDFAEETDLAPMAVYDMLSLVREEMDSAMKIYEGRLIPFETKKKIRNDLVAIFNVIYKGTKTLRESLQKWTEGRRVATTDLKKMGNTIVRMQDACKELKKKQLPAPVTPPSEKPLETRDSAASDTVHGVDQTFYTIYKPTIPGPSSPEDK